MSQSVVLNLPTPEFIAVQLKPEVVVPEPSASPAPTDTTDGKTQKRTKKRKRSEPLLCAATARGLKCAYPGCVRSHDLDAFLKAAPEDLGPRCHVWDTFGKCKSGFACRFASSHVDKERTALLEKPLAEQTPAALLNYDGVLVSQLQKKTYTFAGPGAVEKEKKPVDFKDKIVVASLSTLGNIPFRRIVKSFGADVTMSEMIVCRYLLRGSGSDLKFLRRHPEETCFGIQLAGNKPDELKKTCQLIEKEMSCDFVDFNCGCPIDQICRRGVGAALMPKKARLVECVRAMGEVLSVPLTIKMRTGPDIKTCLAHKILQRLQPLGLVSAAWIHGRSRAQRYVQLPDWDYLENCADVLQSEEHSKIPVLGNGDVLNFMDWNERLASGRLTSCALARGALIKPWLPTEIKEQRIWDIRSGERLDILKRFVNYGLELWGSDQSGVDTTRGMLLQWLSFLHRYVPVAMLEDPVSKRQQISQRVARFVARDDMEQLMASREAQDWIKISEMLLGRVGPDFSFVPKHKATSSKAGWG